MRSQVIQGEKSGGSPKILELGKSLNIEVLGDRIWKRGISGWGLVLHSKK
jgi:hypothetical protein